MPENKNFDLDFYNSDELIIKKEHFLQGFEHYLQHTKSYTRDPEWTKELMDSVHKFLEDRNLCNYNDFFNYLEDEFKDKGDYDKETFIFEKVRSAITVATILKRNEVQHIEITEKDILNNYNQGLLTETGAKKEFEKGLKSEIKVKIGTLDKTLPPLTNIEQIDALTKVLILKLSEKNFPSH